MQSCKVLLVDDEPLVIDAIKRALHKKSYEVVSAGCATEALDILSRQSFDVVVSDEVYALYAGVRFPRSGLRSIS